MNAPQAGERDPAPALAVVLVTWNVRELALAALESLFEDLTAQGPPDSQVWLVDNASADGTIQAVAQRFPQVNLIASENNLGFGAGNNLALRAMGFGGQSATQLPGAVYLLNPDTLTQPGATRSLYDALFKAPNVGLVGAQLSYEDGSFQHSAFQFPGLRQLWAEFYPLPGRLIEGRFNGRYPRALYVAGRPFAIDFPLGATMMLRREVIETTGMFDEGYALYCEEIDWAWRIRKAGWQAQCVPAAQVTHLEGRSSGQARRESVIRLWRSRLRLYRAHHPRWRVWLARQLIMRGLRRRIRLLRRVEQDAALVGACETVLAEVQRAGDTD